MRRQALQNVEANFTSFLKRTNHSSSMPPFRGFFSNFRRKDSPPRGATTPARKDNIDPEQSSTPLKPAPASESFSALQSVPTTTAQSVPMAHTPIRAKLEALSNEVAKADPDLDKCASVLVELKIALTSLPGLQPGAPITEAAIPDITLARDVYEVAALLSLKQEDELSFERHVAQAKTYYVDFEGVIPDSPRQNLILGLNLMRLMAQNRIGEFHTELELVPKESRKDKYIDYALRLEHYLMEGSYSKIREEKIAVPDPSFMFFVDNLMVTVREEIADCSERAYTSLSKESAQRMLSLTTEGELGEFCSSRGWRLEQGIIHFSNTADAKAAVEQIPSNELIQRSLTYARELEQII